MSNKLDLDSLIDAYESSQGRILREFINDSKYLLQIHDANFNEITLLIEEYESVTTTSTLQSKAEIVDVGRVASQEYLARFLRFMHNYCASLYTIEQQYTEFLTARHYRGAPYNIKIGEVFRELLANPKYLFFFAMRNYFSHLRIPDIKVGVLHSKRTDVNNSDTIFMTRGRFTIANRFFSSDINMVFFENTSKYKSRLITDEKRLKILAQFITKVARHHIDIEIKDILYELQNELHDHLKRINKMLVDENKDQYIESVKLIEEIKKRQDTLRKT